MVGMVDCRIVLPFDWSTKDPAKVSSLGNRLCDGTISQQLFGHDLRSHVSTQEDVDSSRLVVLRICQLEPHDVR